MVVRLMRWRARPPPESKNYEVKLTVRSLRGFDPVQEVDTDETEDHQRLLVEVRWKGPKLALMSSLRRVSVKRNFTKESELAGDGVVSWDEEFVSFCSLASTAYKDSVYHRWEIGFTVFNARAQQSKSKAPIVGTASVNIAEYASASSSEQSNIELNIPLLSHACASDPPLLLSMKLSLVEVSSTEQRTIAASATSPSRSGEKSELSSALKASLQKVKNITEFVSTSNGKSKKACDETERNDGSSEDGSEYTLYPADSVSDSLCDSVEEDRDEEDGKEEEEEDFVSSDGINKSFNYGSLAYANFAGGFRVEVQNEDWVYYSSHGRRPDVGSTNNISTAAFEDLGAADEMQMQKRSILLPWRKRKLNFRSAKTKGEPLLKKAYADEGGDDIDFDRRQLSSDESPSFGWGHKIDEDSSANRSSFSEFGDDNFAVGSWEHKDITSRDGHMKLQTEVFFASIDQRSERAAGESACTALVAVITDWFQTNPNLMPIKSQFDTLIRDGSSEWRNLCQNEEYMQRFPDKHFDLETVLESKIRAISVVPEKSFIGFFHPEGESVSEEGKFDFLEGSLSFDGILDEISRDTDTTRIYIVSWNDHFFVVRVEGEAYYLIDTLGERLYEGCNEAYVLKFDSNTVILRLPCKVEDGEGEEAVVCRGGKECCREYIKRFLAAIPIRELQSDVQKGLGASTSLHQRLQIEFHYTQLLSQLQPPSELPVPS